MTKAAVQVVPLTRDESRVLAVIVKSAHQTLVAHRDDPDVNKQHQEAFIALVASMATKLGVNLDV